MSLIDNAVAEIRGQGYTIVRNLISGDRLQQMQDDAESLLQEMPVKSIDGGTTTGRFHKGTFAVSRSFDDIIVEPTLLAIVARVLDPARIAEYPHHEELMAHIASLPSSDAQGIKCNIMVKDNAPREDIRSLHRDVQLPIPLPHAPVVCNSLLALDPFTEERGATCVIPESHRWPSADAPDVEPIPVIMDPGSIVIFDGELWHGHGPNLTHDLFRRCLNLNYHYRWLPYFANPRLPDDVWQSLAPDLRAVA